MKVGALLIIIKNPFECFYFFLLQGIKKIIQQLGKYVKMQIPVIGFNHLDFSYSRFANKKVYQTIIKNIRLYNY